MYDDAVVEYAKVAAIKKVKSDRDKYIKFLEVAKQFAIAHKMYILETFKASDLDNYKYTFYTVGAIKLSVEMAAAMRAVDTTLAKFTKVITNIKYYSFSIIIDERELVRMYNVNYNINTIVKPIYKDEMLYLGADIKNVYILEKLCSPAEYANWPQLVQELDYDIDYDLIKIGGGPSIDMSKICELIVDFLQTDNSVLIGSYAIKREKFKANRIQIISANSNDTNIRKFGELLAPYNFTYTEADLKFITDIRLKRITLYVDSRPIMDIFNTAQYELVPYVEVGGLKIGNIFVLLRFRMIDFWTIKILLLLGAIGADYANILSRNLREDCEILIANLKKNTLAHLSIDYKFIGIIRSLELEIKRNQDDFIMPKFIL